MKNADPLKTWGFGGVYNKIWTPSSTVKEFTEKWITTFPTVIGAIGILLFSDDTQKHPMIAANYICYRLFNADKINNIIHLITFPELMVRFGASIEEHQERLTSHRRWTIEADLIVFSEPAVAKLTSDNRFLLQMLIESRVKARKPFLITCSQSLEELTEYIGSPIFSLINLSCQVVRV